MKYSIFVLSMLCALAIPVSAQTSTPLMATQVIGAGGGSGSGAYAVSVGNGPLGPAVAGAPYSAEQQRERVQTLADGTHITQTEPGEKIWRDSQGRTRTERSLMPGRIQAPGAPPPPNIIEIMDPVEGVHYLIDPQTKTAHRAKVPAPAVRNAAGQTVARSATISSVPSGATSSSSTPPGFIGRPQADRQRAPQFSMEDLGTEIIEGVSAKGRLQTTTLPVGAVGNDRPLVTTNETWTSTELHITVLSKTSDPRNGDTTMRLINISRAEPDPTLFQAPPDYQIEEEPGNSISIRSPSSPPPPPAPAR